MGPARAFSLLLVFIFLATSHAIPTEERRRSVSQPTSSKVDYQLPTFVVPEAYSIELEPDFVTDTFNGSVVITFNVTTATSTIVLHGEDLEIDRDSITVTGPDGTIARVQAYTFSNDDRYFHSFVFNRIFPVNNGYILSIPYYSGILHKDNGGFYLAYYTDENGNEKKIGVTQFESTDARRAFPSFDEPALKAKFTLSMIRPENYTTIANFPPRVSGELVTEGRYRDVFSSDVKMSTYLLAFLVSDFIPTEAMDIHHVYARPQYVRSGMADYALHVGHLALNAISEFVNVPYSLEKMDQVAIPDNYYAAGAMENWGLVTYRESYLMYDPNITTTSLQQSVCTVISHEFGHQWFGDLVSPKWWQYIWLNEGFATYFENYAAADVEPDWELKEQFVIKTLQAAFNPDSLETTRSMNADAGSPRDISNLFDSIAYDKAGSVIRMTEGFLSTPVFREGLNIYLNKMQYDAAVPEDLYTSYQAAVSRSNLKLLPDATTVSNVLSTWDSLEGYPVVNVSINYDTGAVTLSQKRFLLRNANPDSNSVWIIPINFATQSNNDFLNTSTDYWLQRQSGSVNVAGVKSGEWLIANKQQIGYYRVNYEEENWRNIIDYLHSNDFDNIDKVNRAQLVDDVFNLARSGRLNYDIAFELGTYLSKETEYISFYPFFNAIDFLNIQLASDPFIYGKFQDYVIDAVVNVHRDVLGYEEKPEDTHTQTLNRINIVNTLCKYGYEECRDYALEQVRAWQSTNTNNIALNLQTPLFCGAASIATQSDFNFLYSRYEAASDSALRSRILSGLGCLEDTGVLEGYLHRIIFNTSSSLRPEDRSAALSNIITGSRPGRLFLLTYVEQNYDEVADVFVVSSVLNLIGSRLASYSDLVEVQVVAASHSLDSSIWTGLSQNILWNDEHLSEIEAYLSTYVVQRSPDGASSYVPSIIMTVSLALISIYLSLM